MLQAIVSMKHCPSGHKWREIAKEVGLERSQARTKYVNWQRYGTGGVGPGICPLCDSSEPSVKFTEHGNNAAAVVEDVDITNLEDALAHLSAQGVDLDEWQVRDWEIKYWPVGAKMKRGELHWEDGKIVDGHLWYEGLGKLQLTSVYIRFVRKSPIAIRPVIQPIQAVQVYPFPERKVVGRAQKMLVVADVHGGFRKRIRDAKLIPFHDRQVLDLVSQVAQIERPDVIVFDGDTFDLADWSQRWLKEPSFYFTTQPMIIEMHWRFARLREENPDAQILVHQGNHSLRVPNAMLTSLAAAYGLRAADELELPPQLSLPRLLALHELAIEWVGGYPDDEHWLTDEIRAKHGNKASSIPGATARKVLEDGASTVYGHDHMKALLWDLVVAKDGNRRIFAYNPGCACHIDGRVPGHSKDQNWQKGFGLIEECQGIVTFVDAHVVDGKAVWRGELLEARDDLPMLKEAYPDWNW